MMRRRWSMLLALVIGESTILGAAPSRAPMSADWLVEPERGLGPVDLFMTKDQVRTVLGPPDQVVADGSWWYYEADDLTVMFSPEEPSAFVLGLKGGMSPIGNFSHAFQARTRDGIGIGSTHEDVIRYYGKPSWDEIDSLGEELLEFPNRLDLRIRDGRVAEIQVMVPHHIKRNKNAA